MFTRTQQPKKLYALVSTADNFFSADAQVLRALHELKLPSSTDVIFDNGDEFSASAAYCRRRFDSWADYGGTGNERDISGEIVANSGRTRIATFVYIPSSATRSGVEEVLRRCSDEGIVTEERKMY